MYNNILISLLISHNTPKGWWMSTDLRVFRYSCHRIEIGGGSNNISNPESGNSILDTNIIKEISKEKNCGAPSNFRSDRLIYTPQRILYLDTDRCKLCIIPVEAFLLRVFPDVVVRTQFKFKISKML